MKKYEKIEYGYRCAAYMLFATLLLALLKFFIGWVADSLVLIADGMHSAIDTIVIFVAYLGLRISKKTPTQRFPYGYYRAESISALFISAFIIAVSMEFFYKGYKSFFEIRKINIPYIAMLTAFISVIASYLMAKYLSKVGKITNTQSLLATSNERKMDMISSMVVALAIFLDMYGIPYIEGIVTIAVASIIFRTGIMSMKDSVASLMDVCPIDIEKKIKKIIDEAEIKGYRDLRLRKAGPFIFGEVKIMVDKKMDIEKAHEVADDIECKIKEIDGIDDFITHVEPVEKEKINVAIAVNKKNFNGEPCKFGRAKYFLIAELDMEKKEIENTKFVENPYADKELHAGLAAAKLLSKYGIDAVIVREIGEISFYALKDKKIDIYSGMGDIMENIKNFYDGLLLQIKKPKKVE